MFGRVEFATIKNLKLTNLRSTGAWSAGGLVGDCLGGAQALATAREQLVFDV